MSLGHWRLSSVAKGIGSLDAKVGMSTPVSSDHSSCSSLLVFERKNLPIGKTKAAQISASSPMQDYNLLAHHHLNLEHPKQFSKQ